MRNLLDQKTETGEKTTMAYRHSETTGTTDGYLGASVLKSFPLMLFGAGRPVADSRSACFSKKSTVSFLDEGAVPTSEEQPSHVTELPMARQIANFASEREAK
jgi:hypothetical protein